MKRLSCALLSILFKIKKIIWHFEYTGERVIATEMKEDTKTWVEHLSRYVFAIPYCTKKECLDVACGSGYGTSILSSVAKKIEGVDKEQSIIDWASINNIFFCPVQLKKIDIEKNNIEGLYDIILCFETIEHLNNPNLFLQKINKILKNNGLLIFSIPLSNFKNKYHKLIFNWISVKKLMHNSLKGEIKWYSQIKQNITLEENKKATHAIGIWIKHE